MEPVIEEQFISQGLVRLEYRDFPFLSDASTLAAEAASCADDQGAFWPYHDMIFLNQQNPAIAEFNAETFGTFAEMLDLDTVAFNQCLTNHEHLEAVQQSVAGAEELGVNGTPSFLINGELVENLESYGDLLDQINAAIEANQ